MTSSTWRGPEQYFIAKNARNGFWQWRSLYTTHMSLDQLTRYFILFSIISYAATVAGIWCWRESEKILKFMSFVPNIAPPQGRLKTISFFIAHIVVLADTYCIICISYTFSTMCPISSKSSKFKKSQRPTKNWRKHTFWNIFYCEESICRHFDKHLPTPIHSIHPIALMYSEIWNIKYTPKVC